VTRDTAEGAALLDAASALLAAEGPEALTVRRIAARAGCSTMLVYSRLGGKAGVVEALFIEGFERLAKAIRSVRAGDNPLADLRRCARAYRKFALDNPTYYAVMFEGAVPDFAWTPEAAAVAAGTLGVLTERVQRAIDAGVLVAGPAREIAACLWAANHGCVSLELKQVGPPDIDWPKRYAQVSDAMLTGLAPSASHSS
jgi:AcrR family transcriptional regulator